MAGDLLSTGLSGLLAQHRALNTTSHNISNVNTEGYSRQRPELTTRNPQQLGGMFFGTGVDVSNIERVYNEFLGDEVRNQTSSHSDLKRFHELSSQVDNLLARPEAGLSEGLQRFFDAVQGVSSDPSSVPARQVMISEAGLLADRFHSLEDRMDQIQSTVNTQLKTEITEINALAKGIAELNGRIAETAGQNNGKPAPDLLDQRDAALEDLAERVDVTTVTQDNAAVNVFIGKGQSLVVGNQANSLNTTKNAFDPSRLDVSYDSGGGSNAISDELSGGTLGGALRFRDQVLEPAQNALGRVGVGLAQDVNRQHQMGVDMNGDLGGDFFSEPQPQVQANSNNTGSGTVSAAVDDASELTTSDYRLSYQGGDIYNLTRESDGQTFTIDTGGAANYTSRVIDGFHVDISEGADVEDSFQVRPTRNGAVDFQRLIDEPAKVAAASPIRTQAELTNTGDATISQGQVNHPDNKVAIQFTGPSTYDVVDQTTGATLAQGEGYTSGDAISYNGWTTTISDNAGSPAAGDVFYVEDGLTSADSSNTGGAQISSATVNPPDPNVQDAVTITFDDPPNTFDVTGASTGSPTNNVAYTDGQPISYNGWTTTIEGQPAAGDTFTIRSNTNGVSDNRNALELAELQTEPTLSGESASYQEAYGQFVAEVGTQTREAQVSRDARDALKDQALEARDRVSGVNLDEEAANLMRYQQAYQASAQVISTADQLFQSLITAVGR